ncbi:serine hydroxymethyltransferase, partial [Mycoplasmopsis pullorum]
HTFCERFKELGATIVSGGTDNHLFLIDVWKTYGINGKQAEVILEELNITTNKNTIPFDTLSPTLGSGLRLGSAAMTSRDFNKWVELADLIHYVLKNYDFLSSDDENAQAKKKELRAQVLDWTREFPIKKSYL